MHTQIGLLACEEIFSSFVATHIAFRSNSRFQRTYNNNNAPMAVSTLSASTKREGSAAPSNDGGGGSVPSGFILKLFQMVNGAPDDLISVSANMEQIFFSKFYELL